MTTYEKEGFVILMVGINFYEIILFKKIRSMTHIIIPPPVGYKRVYLPLCEVADTPFQI